MAATKEYEKEGLTVIWETDKCIHSELCARGLIQVFNPKNRPWVNMDGAPIEKIRRQVDKCPSGALSHKGEVDLSDSYDVQIQIIENGPLMITGNLQIDTPVGKLKSKQKATAFCRCGYSSNKPFCDGSHKTNNFIG